MISFTLISGCGSSSKRMLGFHCRQSSFRMALNWPARRKRTSGSQCGRTFTLLVDHLIIVHLFGELRRKALFLRWIRFFFFSVPCRPPSLTSSPFFSFLFLLPCFLLFHLLLLPLLSSSYLSSSSLLFFMSLLLCHLFSHSASSPVSIRFPILPLSARFFLHSASFLIRFFIFIALQLIVEVFPLHQISCSDVPLPGICALPLLKTCYWQGRLFVKTNLSS